MRISFLPTATKAELEAAHMAKINPPSPPEIQDMEIDGISMMHKAIVGAPVRIEVPLNSVMEARDLVRSLIDALTRVDVVLTDHIQNPKPVRGKDKIMDWMVLAQAKSIIRAAQKITPSRQGSRRKVK